MRKLYLLSDEWNNDRNFVSSELELIKKYFDVTVVCNDNPEKENISYLQGIDFVFYKRDKGLGVVLALIKCLFDVSFWRELRNLTNEQNKLKKLSEIIRFYINAELFWNYFRTNCLIDNNTDAIVYSYWYFWKCFAVTKHRKKYNNLKIITRTHEYDLFTVSVPSGYQPFKYEMDKNLDKIIFIAEQGREYYINKYFSRDYMNQEKYLMYHLGTKDYKKMNPYVHGDTFRLVSCSSVIPRKRVKIIAESLSYITDKKIEWVHFGEGDLLDDLKETVEELTDRNKNISCIIRGYTKHDDIMDYYANNSIDAFAMVAISEGNPVSVIEAMSFGIPILSYNICNMPNLVKGCGLLIDEDSSPRDLAGAITKLIETDENTITLYRKKARDIWEHEYNEVNNNRLFLEEVIFNL